MRRRLRAHPPAIPGPGTRDALGRALLSWLASRGDFRTVATFAALPGEPDLLPLLAARPDLLWCLPRVDGPVLRLHHVVAPSGLHPGKFGVREPDPGWPAVAPDEVDLFLCPGLAFDHAGHRLGRGAGYYDRLLAAARPSAPRCGVAFPTRILPAVPAEAHDVTMHFLARPGGIEPCHP